MIGYRLKKYKEKFAKQSVKNKLTIIILSVSVVCTIFAVLAFSIYGVVNIRKEMSADLSITGTIISNRVNAALYFKNNSVALETLSALSANPAIQMACVYDKEGNIFARFFSGKLSNPKCPKIAAENVGFIDKKLKLYKEVIDDFDNTVLGTVYIESDLSRISNFIHKQTIIALSIILFVLTIGYFLATRLQTIISQPLRYLINQNNEIDEYLPQDSGHMKNANEIMKLEYVMSSMCRRVRLLEKQVYNSDRQFKEMVRNSEATFSYLSNELKQPLEATLAFGDIISTRSIGEINKEYVSYYNDVYLNVFYYYGVINDTMTFFKRHLRDKNHHQNSTKVDIVVLLESILKAASDSPAEYLSNFDFKYSVVSNSHLPEMLIDKLILSEIINNALFVYVKYLTFLKINELTLQINTKVDDSDPDSVKFKIELMCEQLENGNIANILENHRDYQSDVHLLRSKLQFLRYLSSYCGGYLDYGDDMRCLFKMVLMFPIEQVVTLEDYDMIDGGVFGRIEK